MKRSINMKMYKKWIVGALSVFALSLTPFAPLWAADYKLDTEGRHASILFRVQHLGYSWLYGRFNDFEGHFSYDAKNEKKTSVEVTINTKSVDTNHAARDKHIRSSDFLDVSKYPSARFVSAAYKPKGKNKGVLEGFLTLKGVTKRIAINVEKIGEGRDPWGNYRAGFEGRASFTMKDFNVNKDLGPKSKTVEMILSIEGIKK